MGAGAGAPELGVTGVDLTSNVPAGSGARCFQEDRGSKQNTNHPGPPALTYLLEDHCPRAENHNTGTAGEVDKK